MIWIRAGSTDTRVLLRVWKIKRQIPANFQASEPLSERNFWRCDVLDGMAAENVIF